MNGLKAYWLPLLFCLLAACSRAAYALLGAQVDEQGVLREPFALLAGSWLLLLLALLSFMVIRLKRRRRG